MSRTELMIELNKRIDPQAKPGSVIAGASQVWRFINEIEVGDWVVTYSPRNTRLTSSEKLVVLPRFTLIGPTKG